MVVGDEIKRLALFLETHGGLHRAEIVPDVEFSAGLETGENSHGAQHGSQARNRSSGEMARPANSHSSANKALTISTHFTPGITLRSIWFIT